MLRSLLNYNHISLREFQNAAAHHKDVLCVCARVCGFTGFGILRSQEFENEVEGKESYLLSWNKSKTYRWVRQQLLPSDCADMVETH